MVKAGDDVTYVDENGAQTKARVIGVMTQKSGKKEILDLQYFGKGTVLKVNSVQHESERPANANNEKVCVWK